MIMKRIVKKIALIALFTMCAVVETKADSDVYFFIDFWHSSYPIVINGQEAFTLNPEERTQIPGGAAVYNMYARKVIFKHPGSYVISVECPTAKGLDKAEQNLTIEDGETYYILFNSNIKKSFYSEELTQVAGEKLLKKAQKSKKYTINEDIVYEGQ